MNFLYYFLLIITLLGSCHFVYTNIETNYVDEPYKELYSKEFNEIDLKFNIKKHSQYHHFNDLLKKTIYIQMNSPKPPPSNEIIQKKGYPCEIHDIITEDGYILRVFRIPYGRKGEQLKIGRPPLLLQHGILCSSDSWLVGDPSKALGFRLADEGYDVWIGNSRGNTYSKKHKTLSTSDPKFWDFSVHELGVKDLPAVIDYMLNSTGNENITYVGHSQGTTQFFIFASVLPEYNHKIRVMSAFGPVAFLDDMNGLTMVLARFSKTIKYFTELFGIYEVLEPSYFYHILTSYICHPNTIFMKFCEFWIFIITGFDSPEFDQSLLKVITEYMPAGSSVKQLEHFSQFTKGRFSWFDYGPEVNTKLYNSSVPPQYNLTQITAPVVFHYAENDYIATVPEVNKLYWLLPNLVGMFRVPFKLFNHVDFMWAKDVNKLLYDQAIYIIKRFL